MRSPSLFARVKNFCLDLIFPRRCAGCGREGCYLCAACLGTLPPAPPLYDANHFACWPYHERTAKHLIWLLKYGGIFSVAADLAPALEARLTEELADHLALYPSAGPIILVPIPLHRRKFRRRGYNQADKLARALAARDPGLYHVSDCLEKIKDAPAQARLKNRRDRLANIQGSFRLKDGSNLKGRVVIIIDDVITTGATVSEAARVLHATRPKKILAAVLAHG